MPYVYSTLSNDSYYCQYIKGGADLPTLEKKVLVKGGSGVANKLRVTPLGVVTHVTDADMDFLMNNEAFKRHMAAGFLRVDKRKVEPEVVAADMRTRDGSAPKVPEDGNPASADKPAAIKEKVVAKTK